MKIRLICFRLSAACTFLLLLCCCCCSVISGQAIASGAVLKIQGSGKRSARGTNSRRGGYEQKKSGNSERSSDVQQADAVTSVNPKLQPDPEVAVLETDYGRIVIELYPKLAPQMVELFKRLINEGFYNGTTFHRTSPALGIIQGGDPLSKDADPANDGYGHSTYPDLPAEFSDVPFERATVGAAARAADPNSANSQFFIMLRRQSFFDRKYTVFGRVIDGLAYAYIIGLSPVVRGTERPEDPVVIKRVTLRPRKRFVSSN